MPGSVVTDITEPMTLQRSCFSGHEPPQYSCIAKVELEDEHAWEPRSASATELAAVVTPEGQITAFSTEAIGGTFRGRPRSGAVHEPAKLLQIIFAQQKLAARRFTQHESPWWIIKLGSNL